MRSKTNKAAVKALGWASIAIGATELVATRWLEEKIGVENHDLLIRSFGAREVATGVALLTAGSNQMRANGLWGRVVGDAADLSLLGLAAVRTRNPLGLGIILSTVAGITGVDIYFALRVQTEALKVKAMEQRHREALASSRSHQMPGDGNREEVPSMAH